MSLLRALLVTDPLIIFFTMLYGARSFFVSFLDTDGSRQISLARRWAARLLQVSRVRVTVEGIENLPAGVPCVLASNHLSYMDTPVVLAHVPLPFRFLAKRGLFQIPFLGSHLHRAGHVPVFRGNPRQALRTLTLAAETIQQRSVSLLIFPEGGRSRDGSLRPFTDGAAYIAIKAHVPLVPIALLGTRDVLPMGSFQPSPGHVRLRIGTPIPTAFLTLHDRARLTAQARAAIAALLESQPAAPAALQ
jgi:1-acyl-sn-glycerol-3-phosphate acyltransferase